nr:alpha/beta hydrolase family protein [Gordonia aichiensis]
MTVAACVAALFLGTAVSAPASAAPAGASDASRIEAVSMSSATRAQVTTYSAAMKRRITVSVLLPRDRSTPSPTLYLLDGIDGGVYTNYTQSGWTYQTDIEKFMADKQVYVVLPIGGTGSYYTDWRSSDPVLKNNRWETFLTKELPPLIAQRFATNGVNAIGGLSMGALGAMSIAVRNPEMYSGVAAFSGCLDQGTPDFRRATAATVETRGGNPNNMWGPITSSLWAAHDPAAHIGALRGKSIYVAVGNGLPDLSLGVKGIASPVGGALESAALRCTEAFKQKADRAGVKITYNFRQGLHSWGYWNEDLHHAWPTIAKALDVRAG